MDTRPSSPCVTALRALVDGRLDAWRGLPAGCHKEDAEAAFGPGDGAPDGVASLAGTLTSFRRYPRSPTVPADVQVWLRDGTIQAVEIGNLVVTKPFTEMLGPPEASERSGVGTVHTQWIYPSRGLVLHVQNITGVIVRAYGFAACSIEEFRKLPWGQIRVERRPIGPRR